MLFSEMKFEKSQKILRKKTLSVQNCKKNVVAWLRDIVVSSYFAKVL